MLPVATAPAAIVFEASTMTTSYMMKAGLPMVNLILRSTLIVSKIFFEKAHSRRPFFFIYLFSQVNNSGYSDYGRRLMFERSWVRIPALYTGWKIFKLICCKNCIDCLKRPKINEKVNKWSITVADGWIRTNTHSLELEATKLNIYALLSQNFICILTTNIAINTYGSLMFGLDGFPDWAMEAAAESNVNCTNPLL